MTDHAKAYARQTVRFACQQADDDNNAALSTLQSAINAGDATDYVTALAYPTPDSTPGDRDRARRLLDDIVTRWAAENQ